MTDLAAKLLGIVLGIVAGIATFHWLNPYIFAFLAFLAGIAVAILVYVLVVRLVADVTGSRP